MASPSLNLAPVLRAAMTVLVALVIFVLMLAVEAGASDRESTGGAFAVWATSATIGLLAWVFVFIDGVGRLRHLRVPWRPGVRWVIGAVILLLLLAAAATTFLLLLTSEMGRKVGNPGVVTMAGPLRPLIPVWTFAIAGTGFVAHYLVQVGPEEIAEVG